MAIRETSCVSERLAVCQRDWLCVRETDCVSERLAVCQRDKMCVRETDCVSERLAVCQRDRLCVRETGCVSERQAVCQRERLCVRETGCVSERLAAHSSKCRSSLVLHATSLRCQSCLPTSMETEDQRGRVKQLGQLWHLAVLSASSPDNLTNGGPTVS